MIKIKSKDEIKKMTRASEIVRDLLFELENIVKPEVTTLTTSLKYIRCSPKSLKRLQPK